MELILKKSNDEMIEQLHAILIACGKRMFEQFQLNHWHPFMNIETFRNLMVNKALYGVYQNDSPVATFNIFSEPRDYYYPELWSHPHEKALYLGQLGIDPTAQGKGIGKWCMKQVEKIAAEKECKAIRFDGLDKHPWLNIFYEKLGYSKRVTVRAFI